MGLLLSPKQPVRTAGGNRRSLWRERLSRLMRRWKAWLLAAFALWFGWWCLGSRTTSRAAGMVVPAAPAQSDFDTAPPTIAYRDATLHPLARFSLTARVLARDDYHLDAGSDLSPTDPVFGWGRMSDSTVLRAIDISQGNRFYYWHAQSFPIPRREIETHSANRHMLPADAHARTLKRVRVGGVVTLDGVLVEADKQDGWRWRSSMTRDDTGYGACEVAYVQGLEIAAR